MSITGVAHFAESLTHQHGCGTPLWKSYRRQMLQVRRCRQERAPSIHWPRDSGDRTYCKSRKEEEVSILLMKEIGKKFKRDYLLLEEASPVKISRLKADILLAFAAVGANATLVFREAFFS